MALSASNPNLLDLGAVNLTDYPFTLAGWFRVPAAAEFMSLMRVLDTSTAYYHCISCHGQVNHEASVVTKRATSSVARSTSSMIPGTWHHVTGVFASADSRRIYLDGGSMDEATDSMDFGEPDYHFAGNPSATPIDFAEIAIIAAELSEAEILTLSLGLSVLALPDPSRVLTYHDCVDRANRPGWGPVASSPGSTIVTDHPRILRTRGGLSKIQPHRFRGPFCLKQSDLQSTSSVLAQPSTSAVDQLSDCPCAAGVALTGMAQSGEVLADVHC